MLTKTLQIDFINVSMDWSRSSYPMFAIFRFVFFLLFCDAILHF